MHPPEYQHSRALSAPELVVVLWHYIKPYKWKFVASTIIRFFGEAIFTSTPLAFATFITLIATGGPQDRIYFYFGLWAGGYLVRTYAQRLGRWLGNQVRENAMIDAETAGIAELVKWPLIEHEAENTGNKLKRVHQGANGVHKILGLWQDQWIGAFTQIVIMFGVVTFINWHIGLTLGLFLVCYWMLSRPFMRRANARARAVNAQDEDVAGFLFEIVNNIRTVKVMHLFPWLKENLITLTTELRRRIYKRITAYQGGASVTTTFAQLARAGFIGFIIYGIFQGRFDVTFLLFFNSYFINLRDSSEQLSESAEELTIARFGITRLQEIYTVSQKNLEHGTTPFPTDWKTITVKNLSFAYGEHEILKNFNLTIKRGERVGIVGLSGAGKSTLFKLLLKEHHNFTGDILFDSTSIKDISADSFADHTAVVLQDTEVFDLSLKNNIALSRTEAENSEESLNKALTVSHVQDFVAKLPSGVETLIGEKGVKLSGGERQRVGIARAVYKEPQILFLDEATSHLDVESEEKIQDSLHQFFKEVTAIVIAHRLTTLKEMDRILVMENGTIIEEGTFEKLYAEKGRFYDLWEKQKL